MFYYWMLGLNKSEQQNARPDKAPAKVLSGWWFQTFFIFHNIWDVILPIDELIFFKMVIAPPTSYTIESNNADVCG
jgi:hypothetical protein